MKAEEARKFIHLARLDTKLRRWRIIALILFAVLVGSSIASRQSQTSFGGGPFIGFLEIEGVIVNDYKRQQHIATFAKNPEGKALVVRVNSPGGTVVGGEALYRQLKNLATQKPVAVVMGELATSAAYMASLGAERVFSYEGTITGSIGVLMQTVQIKELLEGLGIQTETFKSGEFKATPNPLEQITPAVRKQTQATVDEIQEIFVGLVVENRGLSSDQVLRLADGRIFSGRQALKEGLVDELGGEKQALEWLKAEKQVDTELPMRNIVPTEPPFRDFVRGFADASKGVFNGILNKGILNSNSGGLVSIWLR